MFKSMVIRFAVVQLICFLTLSQAVAEPARSPQWLSKINTSMLAWVDHINAEAEFAIGQDISAALGLGLSVNNGQYFQTSGRYYFNAIDQESMLLKGSLTIPLFDDQQSNLSTLMGYQFVFNRTYTADILVGAKASSSIIEPMVALNVGMIW